MGSKHVRPNWQRIKKFVPAPKRVDTVAKFNHFNEFARKLHLKVFFNKRTGRELANQQQEARDQEKAPWEQMSSFSPTPGENAVLERFLTELFAYLFNPKNRNKFKDNLNRGKRSFEGDAKVEQGSGKPKSN